MAKSKSSASSATRKKHARKAAVAHGVVEEPSLPKEKKAKGKDKKKNKEPQKKVYIPPVKPAPVQPDPIDTLGLAQKLPPDLLVVLRRFSKKDSITKRRALEEFQSAWVDQARREGEDGPLLPILEETLPVWLHHSPALFIHPSRRIRLLAVGLHASLLRIPSLRDKVFFHIREVATTDQAEFIIGTWCMAAHDADRQVSSYARESWSNFVSLSSDSSKMLILDEGLLSQLWEFIQRALLDPAGVYLYLNPPQPMVQSPAPSRRGSGRGTPVRKFDDELSMRSKTEEEEENEQDRKARLRVSAFGAAEWVMNSCSKLRKEVLTDSFVAPLTNPALWSTLHHAKMPPFVQLESFGFGQPVVRKSAWSLLQTVLQTCKGYMTTLLPVLSSAILRSAWVEPDPNVRAVMWQPLLMFLKEYPNAWILDASSEEEADENEESDSGESDEEAPKTTKPKESISTAKLSHAYEEFLQFLALGCSGSPVQGYPAVLVVLSTIPSSILAPSSSTSPLADLFTSFWAAIDARVLNSLDRAAASQAFLSSLLECVVFLVRRLLNSSDEDVELLTSGGGAVRKVETAQILVKEQIGRAWEELSAKHLKLEEAIIGTLLARTLFSLHQLDAGLFDAAWNVLATNIRSQVVTMEGNISTLVPTVLKAFSNQFEKDTVPAVASSALIREVVQSALEHCENILKSEEGTTPERVSSLVGILDTFGDFLFENPELAARIDDTLQDHAYRLLLSMPSLVFVYLSYRHDEQRSLQLWHKLLSAIASHPEEADTIIPPLLDAAERGMLPRYLEPRGDELEGLAGGLLSEALSSSSTSSQLSLARRILHAPDHFISRSCFHGLVDSLSAAFNLHFENVLHEEAAPLGVFESPLELIRSLVDNHALIPLPDEVSVSLLPDIFLFAYLLPRFREVDAAEETLARDLCDSWLLCASDEVKQNALAIIKQRLRELIVDCSSVPTPEHILRMLASPCPSLEVDVMVDIFPDRAELDVMLEHLPSVPQDASLAVVDPLAPPASLYKSKRFSKQEYDHAGYSTYARIVHGLLLYLVDDRHTAKENIWALRHILALSLYADELLQIPFIQSPIFADHVTKADLQELIAKVQQLTAYLLASTSQEGWHPRVVSVALEQQASVGFDGAGELVIDLITRAKQDDNVRESRVLYMILQHAFSAVTKAEADQWMLIARKMEKISPSASLAIVLAVTRYAPEPPRLDRYRNELAANMLGVPPSKANTEGLWLLRRLAATAPDPDSDVVFLPQLRAVNLVKACQQWITSDEELDEDVQSEMTLVFLHLVPILQNIPGAHWDLIFDVVENNLENSSFEDASTLVLLSRTLRLFIAIQELALTNKSLRAIWQDRRAADLSLIRDLVGAKLNVERMSVPLSICRELALQIIQDLPNDLISEDTLPKMCHLLLESSVDVQRMAYQLLHEAAKKYTEHLVLEAAVDSEGTMKSELPPELIDILQRSLNHEDSMEESSQDWFGYLLAWMVTFDLFTDASLKVKSGYTDQLRDLGLITSQFLPSILNILGLYGGTVKAFKLDIWAIDQFYLDFYSPDSSMSLQLLAAHLYYRALLLVPSLIRNWLLDCRDRQLSHAVTSYTSSHFSPAIVKAELAQVKSAGASEDLSDEHLTIKVASAVNEITASYTVDENQLELTLKLPPDWPLHSIEIIDTKRVGVADERWRAWVLGVQQILSFKSGRIIDGLSFWKKNVASYFEGVAECAICYSVINVTDNSLPRKPCKTCKNRFHASCLYKWFQTSHSSSCPLCRSEII